MQFPAPLIKGSLIKRYKRFLADIELENGEIITAHCPNTGAMTGCAEPEFEVWVSQATNPKRKLKYTWELSRDFAGNWIGVNTHRANALVAEAIDNKVISELNSYSTVHSEVKYGSENSRIDFLLSADDQPDCFVEVKSVTLLESGNGFFPDAVTSRGSKHLRELGEMARRGKRAVLLFCVQHTGIKTVSAAQHIDPVYVEALVESQRLGLQVMVYGCHIDQEKIVVNQSLEFI